MLSIRDSVKLPFNKSFDGYKNLEKLLIKPDAIIRWTNQEKDNWLSSVLIALRLETQIHLPYLISMERTSI